MDKSSCESNKIEYEIKGLKEFYLFVELMFAVADKKIKKPMKQSDIMDLMNTDVSKQTKFRFTNELIKIGCLVPRGNVEWGKSEIILYEVELDKLYGIFIETELGKKIRRIFKKTSWLFD